jgi:ribosomal protein S18 acetylase RimI-like enzyme
VSPAPPRRAYAFEILGEHHDRAAFTCGVEALDRYLRVQAGQEMRRGYATVFVVTDRMTGEVLGYHTLSMTGIPVDLVPEAIRRKLPRYPTVPAVLLGRLAVSTTARGEGLGRALLIHGLRRATAAEVAWAVFAVDAKDDAARSFYGHYGFRSLLDDPNHLFLTRAQVEAALTGDRQPAGRAGHPVIDPAGPGSGARPAPCDHC